MTKISRYRRRKRRTWENRAGVFVVATLIFACFVDSEGLAYTIAMTGTVVNILLAGGCELLASRWS